MDIIANPAIIFGIAGFCALSVLAVGYGLIALLQHFGIVSGDQ